MFWWHWPSWVVESISGLLLVLFIRYSPKSDLLKIGIVATAVSAAYEYGLDCNHWSWVDFGQREIAIVATLALLLLVPIIIAKLHTKR